MKIYCSRIYIISWKYLFLRLTNDTQWNLKAIEDILEPFKMVMIHSELVGYLYEK